MRVIEFLDKSAVSYQVSEHLSAFTAQQMAAAEHEGRLTSRSASGAGVRRRFRGRRREGSLTGRKCATILSTRVPGLRTCLRIDHRDRGVVSGR